MNIEGKGGFTKGTSGNPSGRPKIDPAIKEMFKAKGEEAFNVLVKHLVSQDERVSLKAAELLLERAYGKVPQGVIGGDEDDNPVNIVAKIERVIVSNAKN